MRIKALLFVFILFGILNVYSQDNEVPNTFAYHSFSFSPAKVYSENKNTGLGFSGDVRFSLGNNLVGIGAEGGGEINILDHNDSYYELNLLYGREFQIKNRFFVDVFSGLGYFRLNTIETISDRNTGFYEEFEVDYKTIGVPVTVITRLMLKNGFSLGLQFHVNLNKDKFLFGSGIHLQFTRRSRSPYE
ncbi:hypothetical protein Aeqsu_0534 [Aequorivita sublithincola DSM 14238]|uniref:Outer membrane protein beta-barrel domain-containing protein n=1 Tax=Aequorivita sublithincola (strain DSM 14238 / LMG 21431 / ACAM 643 / 9-3) TaxID=746697 RepID=I3YSS8_AEQSU|nr:hypothetical protein [Aequorivita sublithincola]AFL80046.1 hypothetical protein Aeqsu_0534 [Aequorivita sublithincola DSM 14238]